MMRTFEKFNAALALLLIAAVLVGFTTINGKLIFHGPGAILDPIVYDDIRVPLTRAKTVGQGADADFDTFLGGTMAYTFDAATDEELYFTVQMPHDYKLGTALHAHVHWGPTNANTDDVRWCIEYTFADDNETFPGTTALCALSAGGGTADVHQYADLGDIAPSFSGTSGMMICRLYRDADHLDDDYNADATGFEVDFHYEVDAFGSDGEITK